MIGNNFCNNYNGVRYWTGTAVTLINNNFVGNTNYGVYRDEYTAYSYAAYCNNYGNALGAYVYLCHS